MFLIRGEDKGLECWHYVLVDALKMPLLRTKIRQLPCDLDVANYGKIIISGWGESPIEEVTRKVVAGECDFAKAGDGYEIFHVNTTSNEGKEFFAFVAVPEPLAEKFNYLMNKDGSNMNLHQWGNVLEWGWGFPSEEATKEMAEKYDVDHGIIDSAMEDA